MPLSSIKINQFGRGWMPSNSAVNGPKDCLLQMDNVELDDNGILRLIRGYKQIGSNYTNPATDIFSNIISGTRYDYVADNTGVVYRNGVSLFSGGSTTRTAFGVAYEYTLIGSGNVAKKNTAANTYNLGITAPASAPTVSTTNFQTVGFPTTWTTVDTAGTSSNVGGVCHLVSTGTTGNICQTNSMTPSTWDAWDMTDVLTGLDSAPGSVSDLIQITISAASLGQLANITKFTLYFLLDAGTATGLPVANTYQMIDILPSDFVNFYSNPSSSTEQFQTYFRRFDFTRNGTSAATWPTIKGFRVVMTCSASTTVDFHIGGVTFGGGANTPQVIGTDPTRPNTGTSTVSYIQVDVNSGGSYVGISPASAVATFTQVNAFYSGVISAVVPTDPQVNQVWIFRQDDLLNTYYRVAVLTSSNWGSPYVDNTSDADALAIGITFDPTIGNISSILPILAILGPLEGRWFYCTAQFIYPTPIDNPDSVDVANGIKIAGLNSEIFMWAKIISPNGILIGTSRDVYLLTGTYVTLPDGTIDVYYRPMACPYPPISFDASVYNGTVYYMAKDGWRSVDASGNCTLICAPATDVLYQGINRYGYTGINLVGVVPGATRFPVVAANDHIYCSATGATRLDVWDFTRQYWKPVKYGSEVLALTSAPDGTVEAFFNLGLYAIDVVS